MLDRLNPLLEPGGVLLLTECGTSPDHDGEMGSASSTHRIIQPHPNFRLFMTADPSCGEVSRAMRNRCLEISLLDTPSPVAIVPSPPPETRTHSLPLVALTEHASDFFSLVLASGLRDVRSVAAAVTAHSALVARRSRGSSTAEGPPPRALLAWAELSAALRVRSIGSTVLTHDALRSCLTMAYPGSIVGAASTTELKIVEACLAVCLEPDADPPMVEFSDMLTFVGWRGQVEHSLISRVKQEATVWQLVCVAASKGRDAMMSLFSVFVDSFGGVGADGESSVVVSRAKGDVRFQQEEALFLSPVASAALSERDVSMTSSVLLHTVALFSRSAGHADRDLRIRFASRVFIPPESLSGSRMVDYGEVVRYMIATMFDSGAWRHCALMLSELVTEMSVMEKAETGSILESVIATRSHWSTADPRANPDLFRALRRVLQSSTKWVSYELLLDLVDASMGRRLPVIMEEHIELSDARSRLSDKGLQSEIGLGWLGLSCLICEGGHDSSTIGGTSRRGQSADNRLARSAVAPYVLPLLRGVDGVVKVLTCKEAVDVVSSKGIGVNPEKMLDAVRDILEARDTISGVLSATPCKTSLSRLDITEGEAHSLAFEWDHFLVAWEWLQKARFKLESYVAEFPALSQLPQTVPVEFAGLKAICSRLDGAVLEHAGGAAPLRNTLWIHGERAAAPSSASGALALGKLNRLSEKFRVFDGLDGLTSGVNAGARGIVTLKSLVRAAHPALCMTGDFRKELLHALCTLHWAASTELEQEITLHTTSAVATPANAAPANINIRGSAFNGVGVKMVEGPAVDPVHAPLVVLPEVLEKELENTQSRFLARHESALGAGAWRDGVQNDEDESSPVRGERFDEFDIEATEAVANATLLVAGNEVDDKVVARMADGSLSDNLLLDWATLQLAPLREHWIASEECEILAILSGMVVQQTTLGRDEVAPVMSRVARLRSAILSTSSMSPALARPYQTLVWAWEDSSTWPVLWKKLVSRLVTVALDAWGRRLWEDVVGFPSVLSLELSPPKMDAERSGGDKRYCGTSRLEVHEGPTQLVELGRSSFLLRLTSCSSLHRLGNTPGGYPDLSLLNASARLGQFRAAIRAVRDLRYGNAGSTINALIDLSWARLISTLQAFDGLLTAYDGRGNAGEELGGFAVLLARTQSVEGVTLWERFEAPLRIMLRACPDDRMAGHSDSLVVPAVKTLARAIEFTEKEVPGVATCVGLGMVFVGCLRLVLLVPSSPVDPGLKPALQKELLENRLAKLIRELTVLRWSLRIQGEGDLSPEVKFPSTIVI